MSKPAALFKYDEIVNHFTAALEKGLLPKGNKLPSLRKISRQFNCALSVAMQAYRILEMQGLVHAVEKSGFFAIPTIGRPISLPPRAQFPLAPIEPRIKNSISRIIDLSNNPNLVQLGAAIPDVSLLPTPALTRLITQNAKAMPELLATYTPGKGNLVLRQALAAYLFKKGIQVELDEILISNGCMAALSLALRSATSEGDVVAIENPVYFGLISLLRQLKRKVIEIPTLAESGMDLEALTTAAKKHRIKACLVSAAFQNPLGFVMPDKNKIQLVALAEKFGFMVIEDDIYGDTAFSQKSFRPIRHYDNANRVMYCASFSKSIAPGMRIGWLLPGRRHLPACESMAFSESLGGPTLLQKSMADFLNQGMHDFFIKTLRKKLTEQNHRIKDAVMAHFPEDIHISNPQGGYFLWVELAKHVKANRIVEESLKRGVCLLPGTIFTTTQRYQNCLRISCGAPVTTKTLAAIHWLGKLIRNNQ